MADQIEWPGRQCDAISHGGPSVVVSVYRRRLFGVVAALGLAAFAMSKLSNGSAASARSTRQLLDLTRERNGDDLVHMGHGHQGDSFSNDTWDVSDVLCFRRE